MRIGTICLNVILLLALLLPGPVSIAETATPETAKPVMASPDDESKAIINTPDTEPTKEALQSASLMFIENVGQFDEEARFQMWGSPYTLWLAEDGLWITMWGDAENPVPQALRWGEDHRRIAQEPGPREAVHLKLSFVDANPRPHLEPIRPLDTRVSYFKGTDSRQWHTDVPVWGGVRYRDLYPGLDLEVMETDGDWTWRLVAEEDATATLSQVRLRVEGGQAMDLVRADGGMGACVKVQSRVGALSLLLLEAVTPAGQPLEAPAPALKMKSAEILTPFGALHPEPGAITLQNQPDDLAYATFLGGEYTERGRGIAVDRAGAAYVTGETRSTDFPAGPGYDTTYNGGGDAFVVKLNAAGTGLAYATFLGGNGGSESGYGIAVDGMGAAYVTGYTYSANFPTTPGAFDTTYNGGGEYGLDAFVVKLNATGTDLTYATFLGGGDDDWVWGIAVDGLGAAYVTGNTYSFDFPTTPGAFDTTYNGGGDYKGDAFVVKLNTVDTDLAYATFLGGGDGDSGHGIAVDALGAAYVTGSTDSADFPTTPGAFDTTYNGGDAFVVKINPTGSDLAYATFLGSGGGNGIAVGGAGAAYVTGGTISTDFPTGPGYDTTHNGYTDAFVVKLNAAGTGLAYATFLGGEDHDAGMDITVDGLGAAYVTGGTLSADFPAGPGYDTTYNGGDDYDGDAFVVKMNTVGTVLAYATFLGGKDRERGRGIAVDEAGAAYVTGRTESTDFPAGPGYDTTYDGPLYDAFVVKMVMQGTESYSISGCVQDYKGNPLTDTTISIGSDTLATTGTDGTYTLTNLLPGTYTLTADKQSWAFDPPTRTVVLEDDVMDQDFTGIDVSALISEMEYLAGDTNTRLNQLLSESYDIAEDGDYFAVAKQTDQVELIADAIVGGAGVLAEGVDTVGDAQDLMKMNFPGVVGRGWGHVINLRNSHEVARDAFREALLQPITAANTGRAAKEFLNGAHVYYAADIADTAADDLLSDTLIKYNWQMGLQSNLALTNELYPANERLVSTYVQDLGTTTYRTMDNVPFMLPEHQATYIEDLTRRSQANIALASTLEQRALPLHWARDDREAEEDAWLEEFLAKYLLKQLLYLWGDGPAVLAVEAAEWAFDLYRNAQRLKEDMQMMQLAVEGMSGVATSENRIFLNTVHGMDNIVQGIEPQMAEGEILNITNQSVGEYKLFGRWWWCERSSYSSLDLSNTTTYPTVYQALADYEKTGFLGTSYRPLVSEGVNPIPADSADSLLVYYKQDDQGVSPDEGSDIYMDLLGSTDTGTYYITHTNTTWNPVRVVSSGDIQVAMRSQQEAPSIPYPVRGRISVDEDDLTYYSSVRVSNPFTQTATITLTQAIPTDVQIIDLNGEEESEDTLLWHMTLSPGATAELTHTFHYQGSAGQTSQYPEPQLTMTNLAATESVTFTGEAEFLPILPPLTGMGIPPAKVIQGTTVHIPVTVTNRLQTQTASGTVRLELIDFIDQTQPYEDTSEVTLTAGEDQNLTLTLDTANITEGTYLLMAVVESNEGEEEIFAEYVEVRKAEIFLPLILRTP